MGIDGRLVSEADGAHEGLFMEPKKSSTARRLWRMTNETPQGEFVDFDPTQASPPSASGEIPLRVLEPAPVVDWRSSSYDLLNGTEVRDHTNSIPGELFDKLFKR